ncbi:hypothetical protein TSUD_149270 [Trifolium subterraneum]|uniref:Uncharacterized protein n=1 Tax=Trifolium subterraneum TaxID=3900 RepID=A0A2Z6MHQ1_TRISU|nr:hypothetical protein TSUD_149270 [Trifolium subterraneum]
MDVSSVAVLEESSSSEVVNELDSVSENPSSVSAILAALSTTTRSSSKSSSSPSLTGANSFERSQVEQMLSTTRKSHFIGWIHVTNQDDNEC